MADTKSDGAVTKPAGAPRGKPAHDASKRVQLLAAVAVAAVLPLLAYVVHTAGQRTETGSLRDPFDPTTTSEAELRRVHEAVSRVLVAAPSAMSGAVATLESVRAESPGARDLKDSCVGTYGGLMRAQSAGQRARELLMLPDGGERPAVDLGMAERAQAQAALEEATTQTELVAQSRERCHSLYAQASERLHLEPAQRLFRR